VGDQLAGRAGIAELGWVSLLVLVPAVLAGAAAAYVTLLLVELLGPVAIQAATIATSTISTEQSSQLGLIYRYDIIAVTADGAVDFVTRVDPERYPLLDVGDPVVLLRSAVTGVITGVRTPIGQASDVATFGSILLFVISLMFLFFVAVGARSFLQPLRLAWPIVACVVGALATGAVHVLPASADAAPMRPVPDTAELLAPSAGDGPAGADGITITLTGPPRPGLPDDAAAWLRAFPAYWITARLGPDVPDLAYMPMQLAGTGPGIPVVLPAEACSSNGFDGRVPLGATIPRDVAICFAVSPGFTPKRLVVGGLDAPTHLRLPG
jgi:hypothetical protein